MSLSALFRVSIALEADETVHVVGNVPELGMWNYAESLELSAEDKSGVYSNRVILSKNVVDSLLYRYIVIRKLKSASNVLVPVVSRWETHEFPRVFKPDCQNIDEFGVKDDVECVDLGWLTKQSEIHLTVYGLSALEFKSDLLTVNSSIYMRVRAVDIRQWINASAHGFTSSGLFNDGSKLCTSLYVADFSLKPVAFVPQPEIGVLMAKQSYLLYKLQSLVPTHLMFVFEFYKEDPLDGYISENGLQKIGCAILTPAPRPNADCFVLDVFDVNNVNCGTLSVNYAVIYPFADASVNLDTSRTFDRFWAPSRTLDIGHRGVGKSFMVDALARENTIESLNLAAQLNLDFVEFDVHLSKDFVPLLYHDFDLYCKPESHDKHECEPSFPHRVYLKNFNLAELQKFKFYHNENFKPLCSTDDEAFSKPFPTLENCLNNVDEKLGFLVEIKYPMQLNDMSWECEAVFELNFYVDQILAVILKHSNSNRRIMFTSFVPIVCVMLKLKQNRYPVLFLSQGETGHYPPYRDQLCNSSSMAIDFALCHKLLGVSMYSHDLLKDQTPCLRCKSCDVVWLVWGDDLSEEAVRKKFRELGCHGIIRDKCFL